MSFPLSTGSPGIIEVLEPRKLLSQVSVANFGAVANDGRDDRAAIIAAMTASSPGDTVFFPKGTYNLSDQIFLKGGGRIYKGEDGAIVKGDPSKHIFHIQEDKTRVEGFTLEGKPFMIDKPRSEMVADVVINDNVLRVNSSGSNSSAITFTTGLRNSKITNNRIEISAGKTGLYGYYWDGLTVANNEFLNGGQGIHIDDLKFNSKNLLIEQNLFSGLRRMGVEYQGGGDNSIIQDNWYEKPVMSSDPNQNGEVFAYSVIADRSTNMKVRRNVAICPERPDGKGVRIIFEVGGDNTVVEENYVSGGNHVIAANDGVGTTSILARNNWWENILKGPVGRGLTQTNNGPQVKLSWDIARGKPGVNKRYGSTPVVDLPEVEIPPVQSEPQPQSPPASGTVFLSDLKWDSVVNGWGSVEKDRSNGEQGSADGRTMKLNGTSYAKGLGVHANSEIVYTLNSQYSNFLADVGIDDEVGNGGSVAFQVYLDNVKVYDSGTMTGASATKAVNVDVSGKKTLKLVVSQIGTSKDNDHADWANARLVAASTTPAEEDPDEITEHPTGPQTWLSDLNWLSASNGWGAVEKNRSNGEQGAADGRTMTIRGNTYAKGLGVHSNSTIRYNLGGAYSTFISDLGIDNETSGAGSVVFQIYLDGRLAFDSGLIRGSDAVDQVVLDVGDAQEMRLVVTNGGDNPTDDHADWAGARLIA